jgi:hypothetical protein
MEKEKLLFSGRDGEQCHPLWLYVQLNTSTLMLWMSQIMKSTSLTIVTEHRSQFLEGAITATKSLPLAT